MRTGQKVVLAALLAVSAAALADDWKWDASQRPSPRVGSKFVEELSKTDTHSMKVVAEGQTTDERHEGKETIRLVHSVAAATSAGITEDQITVEKWQRAWDKELDDALEGLVVTIRGEGALRSFSAAGEKPVTKAASRWIEGHLVKNGQHEPTLDELDWDFILPGEPVAPDGEWKIDPAAFARETLGPKASLDAEKSHGVGKLTGVKLEDDVHVGHVSVTVALALDTLGDSKVTWTKGGVQEFRYELDLCLEPRKRDQVTGTITIKLSGSGTVYPPGRDPIVVELDDSSELHVRRQPR